MLRKKRRGRPRARPNGAKWSDVSLQNVHASPEAVQRLSELLTLHKCNLEKLLEQQSDKEKEATAAGEVLRALMREDWDAAASCIERLRPEQLETMVDYSGMTLLHHAVRSLQLPLILQIMEKCPALANRTTLPDRQPGHWTPLMIFANLAARPGGSPQAESERDIGYCTCPWTA